MNNSLIMNRLILIVVFTQFYFNMYPQVTTVLDKGVGYSSKIIIENNKLYTTYSDFPNTQLIVAVDLTNSSFPNSTFLDMGNSRSIGGLTIHNNYLYIAVSGNQTADLREVYRVNLSQQTPVLEEV